jgi:hypothetical protein
MSMAPRFKDTVSRITDKVVAEMADWCNRPLEPGLTLLHMKRESVYRCVQLAA